MEFLALDSTELPPAPQIEEVLAQQFEQPTPVKKGATRAGLFERPENLESYVTRVGRDSSFHPVAWRWLWAWLQADEVLPIRRDQNDSIVCQVLDCLAFYTSVTDTPFMSDLHAAYQLYRTRDFKTAELEARILTGASDEQIESRMQIPSEVVGAFHNVFFDVRGQLGCDS